MADKDRSKFLLSKQALPKVEIPKASAHKKRAFELPASVQRGAAGAPRPAQRVDPAPAAAPAPPEVVPAEPAAPPAEHPSEAEARPSAEAEDTAASESAPPADAAGDTPAGKGKRADSTLRFKDRTLGWFRVGDELDEEEESDEYEAEETVDRRAALWVAVGAVVLISAALALWQLS